MPRRTAPGARVVATHERNIEVIYAHADPRLIGWTAVAEPVWEISITLRTATEVDPRPTRMPYTESALIEWAKNGCENPPPTGPLEFGVPLAERAPGFSLPPEPGWKYLRDCPTYDPLPEEAPA